MTDYNEYEVNLDGLVFMFIAKDCTLTQEEILEYLKKNNYIDDQYIDEYFNSLSNSDSSPNSKQHKSIIDASNRHARQMFRRDLRNGIEWCAKKYGVSPEDIETESVRLAKLETRNA